MLYFVCDESYLDACCLNRPFDDQGQFRVRLETQAILLILEKFYRREWNWIGSDALLSEIRRNPDAENGQRALALLSNTHETVRMSEGILQRAEEFDRQDWVRSMPFTWRQPSMRARMSF